MTEPSQTVRVTYFDTAMALVEVGGLRLLTDPVLDQAGTVFEHGPVRLEKTAGAATTPEALGHIDAVLLSHDQHGDNLDHGGRAFLAHVPVVLTTPLAASRLAGSATVGLAPWQSHTLTSRDGHALSIVAMPAQHGPDGTEGATGPVTGFLLSWNDGATRVYISGDTVPFAGTEEIARRYAPVDLALLHIGRVRLPVMGDAGLSLSAAQAVTYAQALDARHIVPLHFEGWQHFTEQRDAATAALSQSPLADRIVWLDAGQSHSFEL